MTKNMGIPDRITRVILATIPPVLIYNDIISGVFAMVLLGITGFFLITSLFGFCPFYTFFGIRTKKKIED
ncbi:DUF2892 domain-containing protein [Polaribacter litorisediminis]|uniref:YgaP family membrane protein n=1 Tax=Polaribacter litorisediminis TaxID=1908341 RepID=UPI001CBD8937|nr:DUF2892 domain-containing protein [Polaribacter litorisediminis]UAM98163.1 DUF2892 domain-containing protein [Polaribacter litorisediminis]